MSKPMDKAIQEGSIKVIEEVKVEGDQKQEFKKGITFDPEFMVRNKGHSFIAFTQAEKTLTAKLMASSNYVYPPLKRNFAKFIRVTAYVIKAANKFKNLRKTQPEVKECGKVKFQVFANRNTLKGKKSKPNDQNLPRLSDLDLSRSLEYIFKKTTQEVLSLHKKAEVEKIGIMKDDILYCKSRMLEGAELRSVDGLAAQLNLKSLTGIDFNTPVLSCHSPVAISIAHYMHYHVHMHMGPKTTYLLSLEKVNILKGRSLFKEISDDCVFCSKVRKKCVKSMMGSTGRLPTLSVSSLL